MARINYEKLKEYGLEFKNEIELYEYLKETILEYLYKHNKNYTKNQWWRVSELYDIIKCLEIIK